MRHRALIAIAAALLTPGPLDQAYAYTGNVAVPQAQSADDHPSTPPSESRAQPRAPTAKTPPAATKRQPPKSAPRSPGRSPRNRAPAGAPESRTSIYHYYPLFDFDFLYQFPYGAYPYTRYGYPYPPSGYPVPLPGCVAEAPDAYGSVRLDVAQEHATVYVDGFYVGIVDDFDNDGEYLRLVPGPHQIELHAPAFEPLVFNVNVQPGQTLTFRSTMEPAEPPM